MPSRLPWIYHRQDGIPFVFGKAGDKDSIIRDLSQFSEEEMDVIRANYPKVGLREGDVLLYDFLELCIKNYHTDPTRFLSLNFDKDEFQTLFKFCQDRGLYNSGITKEGLAVFNTLQNNRILKSQLFYNKILLAATVIMSIATLIMAIK